VWDERRGELRIPHAYNLPRSPALSRERVDDETNKFGVVDAPMSDPSLFLKESPTINKYSEGILL